MKLRDSKCLGAVVALCLAGTSAMAAENGLTRVLTGAQGYELTLPLYPGLYVDVWGQDYRATKLRDNNGNAAASAATIPGVGTVPISIHDKTTVDIVIPRLTWLTEQTIAEGRLGFGLSLPYARVDQRTDFTSSLPFMADQLAGASAAASGKRSGQGDVEAGAFVDWMNEAGRFSAGMSFGLPTGDYDRTRAANPGFGNFYTIRPFFIASHVFTNGFQVGTFTSYNFNTRNSDTHYRSGQYFHSDLMALYPVTDNWRLGAQAFVLKQTTDDRSDAGTVYGNRSQALGLGPTIAYVSDSDWGVDFKVMKEFAVRNRTEGVVSWLRVHIRLGD